jgi:hypothetical protein
LVRDAGRYKLLAGLGARVLPHERSGVSRAVEVSDPDTGKIAGIGIGDGPESARAAHDCASAAGTGCVPPARRI